MLQIAMVLCIGCTAAPAVAPGDLVFQTSRSSQSAIIAEVTRSPWTHVGVVFERRGQPWVLEAVEPVRWTRFDRWRERGEGGRYIVRRLPRPLTEDELRALRREGVRLLGRRYDARFEWSDRRMYCSELVWKIFERALDVRLTEPQRWSELPLSPRARALARRRLGRMPRGIVVTPTALVDSPRLATVPRLAAME
jgi:hypothetical protein